MVLGWEIVTRGVYLYIVIMIIVFLNFQKKNYHIFIIRVIVIIKLYMHETGPLNPNTIFLGTKKLFGFTIKNTIKLRFYVFLQFMLEKYDIISPEVERIHRNYRNHRFYFKLVWVPGDP